MELENMMRSAKRDVRKRSWQNSAQQHKNRIIELECGIVCGNRKHRTAAE
jgi:hypothetical protein